MKENFKTTLQFILKAEGGRCNDTGGPTNHGLTLKLMKDLRLDLNHDGIVDENDLAFVDASVVEAAFRKEFWDRIGADNLPAGLDLQAADFAYNAGPLAASNIMYGNPDLVLYRERRIAFYDRLCTRNPAKYEKYRHGWTNRAMAAYEAAVKLSVEHGA